MTLSLCLFCGSRAGVDPAYAEGARAFGAFCATHRFRLVYGGGGIGLMGEAARACLAGGGEVVGVIPESLMREEVAQAGLTAMHVVATLHERKALMHDLCDAVVALPGGIGTLDELFEAMTWRELDVHDKPIFVLGPRDFWTPFFVLLEHMAGAGFAPAGLLRLVEQPVGLDDLRERLIGTATTRTA